MTVFNEFLNHYNITADNGNIPFNCNHSSSSDDELVRVLNDLGGKTFGHGVYRVHRSDYVEEATQMVAAMFNLQSTRAIAFAADWTGRQYVVKDSASIGSARTISCVDPGTATAFATDQTIIDFHNITLVKFRNDALAYQSFLEWQLMQPQEITPDTCVGYKVPLFLNGIDRLENYELKSMRVYWHLCAEIWHSIKGLPEGTPIDHINFEH